MIVCLLVGEWLCDDMLLLCVLYDGDEVLIGDFVWCFVFVCYGLMVMFVVFVDLVVLV